MATCYAPEIDTDCARACVKDSLGFYKSPDGDVFDYDFSQIGNQRDDSLTNYSTNKNPGEGHSNIDGEESTHEDLCNAKKAQKLQKESEESGVSSWMSAGELVVWLVVGSVMYGVYNMFESKMKFKESFLCNDLKSGSAFSMENIGKIYVLLCFIIMFAVRKLTQTKTLYKVDLFSIKDYIKDFLPYSVMTLGAYVFFSGYLRIKASDQGMSGGGILDGFKNISSTALTVYIGVLLMVVNAFGLSYFYLKQKALFRKDEYARSLYWAQITTLLIGGLTALCVALFACHGILSAGPYKAAFIAFKWILLIVVVVLSIHGVNKMTSEPHKWIQIDDDLKGGEDWFSLATRAEKEYVNNDDLATHGFLRDEMYRTDPTSGPGISKLNAWKINAYENVYGKCYERSKDDEECRQGCVADGERCVVDGNQCSSYGSSSDCTAASCRWTPVSAATCTGTKADGSECAAHPAFMDEGLAGNCPLEVGCTFTPAVTEASCSAQ